MIGLYIHLYDGQDVYINPIVRTTSVPRIGERFPPVEKLQSLDWHPSVSTWGDNPLLQENEALH